MLKQRLQRAEVMSREMNGDISLARSHLDQRQSPTRNMETRDEIRRSSPTSDLDSLKRSVEALGNISKDREAELQALKDKVKRHAGDYHLTRSSLSPEAHYTTTNNSQQINNDVLMENGRLLVRIAEQSKSLSEAMMANSSLKAGCVAFPNQKFFANIFCSRNFSFGYAFTIT